MKTDPVKLAEAGELLAVEAIDRTGLVVTSEGALVRVLRVTPPEPADPVRRGPRADRGRVLPPGRAACAPASRCSSTSRRARSTSTSCSPTRRREVDGLGRRRRRRAEQPARDAAGALALAAVRGDGGVAAPARRRAGRRRVRRLRRRPVPRRPALDASARSRAAPAARAACSRRRWSAACKAHRRAARESLAHTDAIRGGARGARRCPPPARRRGGARAAVGALQPDPAPTRPRRRPSAARSRSSASSTPRATASEARGRGRRCASAIAALERSTSADRSATSRSTATSSRRSTRPRTARRDHDGLAAGRDDDPPALHAERVRARARPAPRAPAAQARLPAAVRDQPRRRAARPRARLRPLRPGERVQRLLAEMAGHDRASLFEVSIYQSIRARGPEPDLARARRGRRLLRRTRSSRPPTARVNRGEFRQLELWQSTLPLGRDVARRTRKYATRNVGDTVPLVGTSLRVADRDPVRVQPTRAARSSCSTPTTPTHANHTLLINGRGGVGQDDDRQRASWRAASRTARARSCSTAPATTSCSRGWSTGAQQIEIGADDTPVRDQPVGRRGPGRRLPREDRLPGLPARAADGRRRPRPRWSAPSSARRSAPSTRAPRTPGETPRESTAARRAAAAIARASRRTGAVDVAALLRNLAERLGEYCGEGTYAYLLDRETTVPPDARWSSSTPAAARRSCCGR